MTPRLRSLSLGFSTKAQGVFLSAILTAESLTEVGYKKLLPLSTKPPFCILRLCHKFIFMLLS